MRTKVFSAVLCSMLFACQAPTDVSPRVMVIDYGFRDKGGEQVYRLSPSGLPEMNFTHVKNKQIRYLVTSRIASKGFQTLQQGGAPDTLRVEVHRGEEVASGTIRIEGETVQFEIVGDEGDRLLLDMYVRDQSRNILGSVTEYEIILQENMILPMIDIVLSSDGSFTAPVVAPAEVRIIDERMGDTSPTPLYIGAPPDGDPGIQDPDPEPEEPIPTDTPPPTEPPERVQDSVIIRVAEHANEQTTLDAYDITSSTHKTLLTQTKETMRDVSYYRSVPTNTMFILGRNSIQTAPFEHQYLNGKWVVTVGQHWWETLPAPTYSGYVSGRSDVLENITSVRVMDNDRLLLGAPHPVADDQTSLRMWQYERDTGEVHLLSDDSRYGESVQANPFGSKLLYGERTHTGSRLEWSIFSPGTQSYTSLVSPSNVQKFPVGALGRTPEGKDLFAYYEKHTNKFAVQDVQSGHTWRFPAPGEVEALCWNDNGSRLAAINWRGGVDVYSFPEGILLHAGTPYPMGGTTMNSCQFMN